ncbi:hypothetical protein [Nostoc sp. PCC 7107]|uniref:hypothetical protein n=1 Tax=Nostoc sp. PCC 7107 TaxID=317936 RepID=UPI00029F1308|nr:hypothetical protein [Nostoc sp. PCC 7107]AFY43640.1 hypothetical protein Nos7107_3049 [Nostoc sp. PCC 7107]
MQVTLRNQNDMAITDLEIPESYSYPDVIVLDDKAYIRHLRTDDYIEADCYIAESDEIEKAYQSLVNYINSQIPSGSDGNARVLTTKILAGLPQVFTDHPEFLIEAVAQAGKTKKVEA